MMSEKEKTAKLLKSYDAKIKKAEKDLNDLKNKRNSVLLKAMDTAIGKKNISVDVAVDVMLEALNNLATSTTEENLIEENLEDDVEELTDDIEKKNATNTMALK